MTATQLPDHLVASPGDILDEWLDEHAMSQRELAARLGRSEKFLSQLVNAKATLSADIAQELALVTRIDAQVWLTLEANHQAVQARTRSRAANAKHSPVEAELLRFLKKLGVVDSDARDKGLQQQQALGFLRIGSPDAIASLSRRQALAFRTSTAFTPDPLATETLLRLAQDQAELVDTHAFEPAKLRASLPAVRALTLLDPAQGASAARELLASCGVALVFVPSVPKAHCQGVTMWRGGTVIVALSDRGKSEDIFWFTLGHELAHVLDGARDAIYLHGSPRAGDSVAERAATEEEQAADAFAAELLIPADDLWRLDRIGTFADLAREAAALGVSPAIVVGRLQHLGLKPRSWGNGLKRRVEVRWGGAA